MIREKMTVTQSQVGAAEVVRSGEILDVWEVEPMGFAPGLGVGVRGVRDE